MIKVYLCSIIFFCFLLKIYKFCKEFYCEYCTICLVLLNL